MHIDVIATEELGDSYVVHDGRVALVVDPRRDLDRVEEVLAAYVVSADDDVAFERHAVRDGDELAVGSMTVSARTPSRR